VFFFVFLSISYSTLLFLKPARFFRIGGRSAVAWNFVARAFVVFRIWGIAQCVSGPFTRVLAPLSASKVKRSQRRLGMKTPIGAGITLGVGVSHLNASWSEKFARTKFIYRISGICFPVVQANRNAMYRPAVRNTTSTWMEASSGECNFYGSRYSRRPNEWRIELWLDIGKIRRTLLVTYWNRYNSVFLNQAPMFSTTDNSTSTSSTQHNTTRLKAAQHNSKAEGIGNLENGCMTLDDKSPT